MIYTKCDNAENKMWKPNNNGSSNFRDRISQPFPIDIKEAPWSKESQSSSALVQLQHLQHLHCTTATTTMHSLVYLMLIIAGGVFAHYRGVYDSRNLIEREERMFDGDVEIVECPVCVDSGYWLPSNEECTILKGNKKYKKCELGTYINEVCGNRRDCFRGAEEQCTEKMEIDIYGQKCGAGYYCNKLMGICQGLEFVPDSNQQFLLNPHHRYSLPRSGVKTRAVNHFLDTIRN